MDDTTDVPYRLAQTRVVIDGMSETIADPGGRRVVSANAAVQLRTAADPHEWLTLRLPDRAAADRSFTLTQTDDGRLVGTDVTSTGRAGSALTSVVSTVTTIAGVALGVLGKGGLAMGALGDDTSTTWEGQHHDLNERRKALTTARATAQQTILDVQQHAVTTSDPAARRAAMARVADLRRVLAEIEHDLATIETQRTAWLANQADRRSEHHTFVMDIDDLPSEDQVRSWPSDTSKLTSDVVGKLHGPLYALGVVITRRDVTALIRQEQTPAVDGKPYEGVWYRRPRQVELRVYRVVGVDVSDAQPAAVPAAANAVPGGTATGSLGANVDHPADPVAAAHEAAERERAANSSVGAARAAAFVPIFTGNGPVSWLTLVEQREVEIVDKHCRYGYLPFKSAWFGEHATKVDFGALGAPVSIGSSATSVLKDLADALGTLPQQVLSGLETANKIVDQGETAARQGADRRLADLQRRKSILEQELAITDTQSTAQMRSELARVTAEHDLLTGRRDLESVQRDLTLQRDTTDTWRATQLDDLANSLLNEKVERLELQNKLADLRAELTTGPLELAEAIAKVRTELDRLQLVRDKIAEGELPPAPADH